MKPLPRYETTRDKLPSPVDDKKPDWVRMYGKAWELAFRNFHEPAPGSGYVSHFIAAAFTLIVQRSGQRTTHPVTRDRREFLSPSY